MSDYILFALLPAFAAGALVWGLLWTLAEYTVIL